jgi:outer membrane biosynthesis protein TonB
MPRRSARLGVTAVMLVLVSGCGGSSAPSDAVPALGTSLDRVDDAIVEGRYDDARGELDELVATTTNARDDGDLERSEADRILAAAATLMSALPAEEADPAEEEPEPSEEEPEPSEPAPAEPAPEEDDPGEEGSGEDGLSEEEQKKAEKEAEKEQEELEKEQEKLEEELQKEQEEEAEEQAEEEGSNDEGS